MTTTAAELVARLRADNRDFDRGMSQAGQSAQRFGRQVEEVASRSGRRFQAAATVIATSFVGTAVALIRSGSQMEKSISKSSRQFETFIKDSDAAKAHVRDLFAFAKNTPFAGEQIVAAAKKLRLLGGAALETKKNLGIIGDASAATGVEVTTVASLFGFLYQSIQNGQPLGRAGLRMQRMGLLSAESAREMTKLQKAGADSSKVFAVLEKDLGRFAGAMEREANTIGGLRKVIRTTFAEAAGLIIKPFFEPLKRALQLVRDSLQTASFQAFVERLRRSAEAISSSMVSLVDRFKDFRLSFSGIGDFLFDFAKRLGDAKGALLGLAASFASFGLRGIPIIGAVIPQLGAFHSALFGLVLANKETRQELGKLVGLLLASVQPILPRIASAFNTIVRAVTPLIAHAIRLAQIVLPPLISALRIFATIIETVVRHTGAVGLTALIAGFLKVQSAAKGAGGGITGLLRAIRGAGGGGVGGGGGLLAAGGSVAEIAGGLSKISTGASEATTSIKDVADAMTVTTGALSVQQALTRRTNELIGQQTLKHVQAMKQAQLTANAFTVSQSAALQSLVTRRAIIGSAVGTALGSLRDSISQMLSRVSAFVAAHPILVPVAVAAASIALLLQQIEAAKAKGSTLLQQMFEEGLDVQVIDREFGEIQRTFEERGSQIFSFKGIIEGGTNPLLRVKDIFLGLKSGTDALGKSNSLDEAADKIRNFASSADALKFIEKQALEDGLALLTLADNFKASGGDMTSRAVILREAFTLLHDEFERGKKKAEDTASGYTKIKDAALIAGKAADTSANEMVKAAERMQQFFVGIQEGLKNTSEQALPKSQKGINSFTRQMAHDLSEVGARFQRQNEAIQTIIKRGWPPQYIGALKDMNVTQLQVLARSSPKAFETFKDAMIRNANAVATWNALVSANMAGVQTLLEQFKNDPAKRKQIIELGLKGLSPDEIAARIEGVQANVAAFGPVTVSTRLSLEADAKGVSAQVAKNIRGEKQTLSLGDFSAVDPIKIPVEVKDGHESLRQLMEEMNRLRAQPPIRVVVDVAVNNPAGVPLGTPGDRRLLGFAEGAIVNRPTMGVFGEKGPELLLPLSPGQAGRRDQLLRQAGLGGGGGVSIHVEGGITINGSSGNPEKMAEEFMQKVADKMGRRAANLARTQ